MNTQFGTLKHYTKGHIELIDDCASNYVFSNIFEVAEKAAVFEKIAVAKNFEYVLEVIKIEGASPWYVCAHDEFLLVMDGVVQVNFVNPLCELLLSCAGTHQLKAPPEGTSMGRIVAESGALVLLPKNKAYYFTAETTSVGVLQTIAGPLTVEKWREICLIN